MNTPSWDPLNGGSITPNVRNEFGTLKTAMISAMSSPEVYAIAHGATVEECEKIVRAPGSPPKMAAHLDHRELLKKHDVRIVYPHHPNAPLTPATIHDWVGLDLYSHDFLGVVDTNAIFTRVDTFRSECRIHYERIIEQIPKGKVTRRDEFFTWGDALLVDNALVVGLEHPDFLQAMHATLARDHFTQVLERVDMRSKGVTMMRGILEEIRSTRALTMIPLASNVDIDCAVAPLPRLKGTDRRRAIVQKGTVHPMGYEILKRMFDDIIESKDPWKSRACNTLWLNPETPIVSREATTTVQILQDLGYNVIPRNIAAFNDKEILEDGTPGEDGGWRCLTGVLERANDYSY